MMRGLAVNKQQQRGAVALLTALVVLIALSLLTLVGAKVALTQHREANNIAASNAAAAAANAGLQAAEAYLIEHKAQMGSDATNGWLNKDTSLHWEDCASDDTDPPCGNGTDNLYGDKWQYYGPVPSLPTLSGGYNYKAWYLSSMLGEAGQTALNNSCQALELLDQGNSFKIPLLGTVGGLVSEVVETVNNVASNLTGLLNPVLGNLIGKSGVLPQNIGIPPDLCLPINFDSIPAVPPPSRINPTIQVVAISSVNSGPNTAFVQATMQPTSIFNNAPIAAIMSSYDARLLGDVRVWGNPRPPTTDPDFSTINLNHLNPLGLPIGGILRGVIDPLNGPLSGLLGPLVDPILHDALGTNLSNVLELHANVTFPLSIWAGGAVTLAPPVCNPNAVSCDFDPKQKAQEHGFLGNVLSGIGSLFTDPLHFLQNLLGGLLGGVTNVNVLLQSARTCLPEWGGSASNDVCTPLSETVTTLNGTFVQCGLFHLCVKNHWKDGGLAGTSVNLKLPDVQDGTVTLQNVVTGLLNPTGTSPQFPNDLFDYTFRINSSQIKSEHLTNCGDISSGLNWITDDCSLDGTIGSPSTPVIIITTGEITLDPGTRVNGVIYMRNGGTVSGSQDPDDSRATIFGALLADKKGASTDTRCNNDGANTEMSLSLCGQINVVYDQDTIRKAGFLAGSMAPVPGSWNDAWSGP